MRAIVYERYGSTDVLELRDVEKPSVADDGVLVRIRAASTNPYDWHFMRAKPLFTRAMFGWFKPKDHRLGADLAGEVEAVGKDVTRFHVGDPVFGEGVGAFAEYTCVPERWLAKKPTNLSFEQAAAVPMAAGTALQGLRDGGKIQAGQKVLVNGASGGVGTFAVQIAKALGAEVTGVCSTKNVEMVKKLGADRVVDYTRADFTRGEACYDLLLDTIGNRSLHACRRVLAPKAVYVFIGGPMRHLVASMLAGPFVSQDVKAVVAKRSSADLEFLSGLIEAGKVTPVIDRTYPLAEVPAAIRYLEEGHARGKIVITI
ncbi:MAG: NAD(P)-dependent alcohol dehydrogenase [Candidatus Bipolaricaulis sp.]|nr:NAD(P)-dependent alcohol dehydrogenase [Candidatus Bipolaricaulis sp.]